MKTRLRELWGAGGHAVNGWLSIPNTITAEIMSKQDFDSITIDLQHGLIDYQTALGILQAMSAGTATPIARVPWNEPGIIMKLLDAGALGIICPMINTAEDAKRFVGACQYAPRGYRSSGPTRALIVHGPSYFEEADDTIITMAMVETVEAVDNVEAIASTPGLTGIYIGPSDLAVSMGKKPGLDGTDPEVVAAMDKVLAAATKAGIKTGLHCLSPAYAKQMYAKGYAFASLSNDVRILSAALSATVAEARS